MMTTHLRHCLWMKNLCKFKKGVNFYPFQRACSEAKSESREVNFQNEEFTAEKNRQHESVGRISKITVNVSGPPEDFVVYMNKNVSTPYDCARHVSQSVLQRAALALVNSDTIWDMHRPLPSNCSVKFLNFDDENPAIVNIAFWESCSFILGAVIANAFKEDIIVNLHSYPEPDYRTGSFAYDAQLSLENWEPKAQELKVLGSEMMKFCCEGHIFERLDVSKTFAHALFEGSPFKHDQIEKNAVENDKVTLYRIGNHIDISNGPLISHTDMISMCSITAVHQLETSGGKFYRFQGVAIPKPLMLNHFAFELLQQRAKKLNPGKYPFKKLKLLETS